MKKRHLKPGLIGVAILATGCHLHRAAPMNHPSAEMTSTTRPTSMPTTAPESAPAVEAMPPAAPTLPPPVVPVASQTPYVPGVVPGKKPLIALPENPIKPGPSPSVLLLAHARSDSPVSLSEYPNQPVHKLAEFRLRSDLTAADLARRMGPPAQLADYSDPWVVYRLPGRNELWLHFSQLESNGLLAADVVGVDEDGYTRKRVFTAR